MVNMERLRPFISDDLRIDALVENTSSKRGIVITHPHPLYGGDMKNPVVDTIRKVYQQKGFTTLRFNFRGMGNSEGNYDEGRGEQADVIAAVEALRADGLKEIHLAGYSFGAWVNARVATSGLDIHQMVMVSPPVALIEFADVGPLDKLALVISGGRDDIAPPAEIKKGLKTWNPVARFEIIESADHFYGGCLGDLEAILG